MAFLSRIFATAALATTCITGASAQLISLETTYIGGNGQSGNMFDIQASQEIILKTLDVSISTGTQDLEVYYSFGGYTGKTGSLTNWTLAGAGSTTGLGPGIPTPLPFDLNITVPAGEVLGLYVTLTGSGTMDYTNGGTVGSLFATDGLLSFYEGVGIAYPVGGTFTPRVWNGTLYYENPGGTDQSGYLQIGKINGNLEGGNLGRSAALMDDLNADGLRDYAIGNPGEFGGNGRVLMYGAKNKNKLVTIKGATVDGALGTAIANVGDTTGMGLGPDSILVGAPGRSPGHTGEAFLYHNGSTVPDLAFAGITDDLFGSAVAGIGDIDGDSQNDFIVGAPGHDDGPILDVGSFYVYSGATGAQLKHQRATAQDERFGTAVTGLGDVNLDGVPDFAISAPGASQLSSDQHGRVEIWSGATLTKLYDIYGFFPAGEFGTALVDVGDITGDGRSDFAIGSPMEIDMTGAVYLISGSNGEVLYRAEGIKPEGRFGTTLSMLGDTNGDGFLDLGIGAPGIEGTWGYVQILTVDTGIDVGTLIQGSGSTDFGLALCSAGDANEDGLDDILAGSHLEYNNGNKSAGVVRIMTTLGIPSISESFGVHVLNSGNYVIKGTSLVETTVFVDGIEVPVENVSPAELHIPVSATMPGGFHDLRVETDEGTIILDDFLVRYPAINAPSTVTLGGEVSVTVDNGEEGLYFLAWSGATYATPAPFENYGWFHGLDLNGVWLFSQGLFTPEDTSVTITTAAPSTPNLAGTVIYLQALTVQAEQGFAGFTNTVPFTLVSATP